MKQIVKRPLITEKNTYHNAAGIYVFEVDMDSTKADVKTAVEEYFKVKVKSVKTSVGRGRPKLTRFGLGKTPYYKKAYVKLVPGEKIALFEGV